VTGTFECLKDLVSRFNGQWVK